jgi:hypothetical protein
MSTKIYNGYIAKVNISDLLLKFINIQPQFEKIKVEGYSKFLIENSVKGIDEKIMFGEEIKQQVVLFETHEKYCNIISEVVGKGLRDTNLDFSVSVSVLFLKRNTTLLLLYCENKEMIDLWNGLDFIEEYHYQNSTDKPEYITERLWNKRRKDWDIVLGDDAPIKRGYSFTFTDERLPWFFLVNREKYIPDLDQRVLNYFSRSWINNRTLAIMNEKNINTFDAASLFQAKDEWAKFKQTEEYQKQFEEIKQKLPVINFMSSEKEK